MSDARREVTINLNLTGADVTGVVKAKEALTAAHEVKKDLEKPIKLNFEAAAVTALTDDFLKLRDMSVDAFTAIDAGANGAMSGLAAFLASIHEGATAVDGVKQATEDLHAVASKEVPNPFDFGQGLQDRIKEAETLLDFNAEINSAVRDYVREAEKASNIRITSEQEYELAEKLRNALREQWEAQRSSAEAQALLERGIAEENRKDREDRIADIREQGETYRKYAQERLEAIQKEREARRRAESDDSVTAERSKATLEALEAIASKQEDVRDASQAAEEAVARVMQMGAAGKSKSANEASQPTVGPSPEMVAEFTAALAEMEQQEQATAKQAAALAVEVKGIIEDGGGREELVDFARKLGREMVVASDGTLEVADALKVVAQTEREVLSLGKQAENEIKREARERERAAKEAEKLVAKQAAEEEKAAKARERARREAAAAVQVHEEAVAREYRQNQQTIQSYATMATSLVQVAANVRFLASEEKTVEALAIEFATLQSTIGAVTGAAQGFVEVKSFIDGITAARKMASAATVLETTSTGGNTIAKGANALANEAVAVTAGTATTATAGLTSAMAVAAPAVGVLVAGYVAWRLHAAEVRKEEERLQDELEKSQQAYDDLTVSIKNSMSAREAAFNLERGLQDDVLSEQQIQDNLAERLESISGATLAAVREQAKEIKDAIPEEDFKKIEQLDTRIAAYRRSIRAAEDINRPDLVEQRTGRLNALEKQRDDLRNNKNNLDVLESLINRDVAVADLGDVLEKLPGELANRFGDELIKDRQERGEAVVTARSESERGIDSNRGEAEELRARARDAAAQIAEQEQLALNREKFDLDPSNEGRINREFLQANRSVDLSPTKTLDELSQFLTSNNLISSEEAARAREQGGTNARDTIQLLRRELDNNEEFGEAGDDLDQQLQQALEAAGEEADKLRRAAEGYKRLYEDLRGQVSEHAEALRDIERLNRR